MPLTNLLQATPNCYSGARSDVYRLTTFSKYSWRPEYGAGVTLSATALSAIAASELRPSSISFAESVRHPA